ncbi:glycosyltransferase [Psychrobium sp. 1_MG-2023]|uniref:glycosyltransferase n=1 Tax=Psychrobium sp. 1_MG-2023 TaxID=3062624 RepID=UPI000C325A6C|nr:glycosyltransferase [Psychrobium sp. 1_MG-2023]MDP2561128.1 glycosyltransferase [Psychrobium sp. 1_MG-2023]PKF55104.1 sugar transferase [Alteromonadales bacterium alter-6D02]
MTEKPIHVVHILYRFATGGLENGLVNLINQLTFGQFRHSIICITDYDDEFTQRIQRDDVKLITLNKKSGSNFGYLLTLRAHLKSLSPTIIHSRGIAALEAQLASLGMSVVRIHGEHGWDSESAKHNVKHNFLRRLLKPLIHQYVVLSAEGEEFILQHIKVSAGIVERICNGVDTEKFTPVQTSTPASSNITITTVGRLAAVKNQQLLISAVAQLIAEQPTLGLSLQLVGEGECFDVLQQQVTELALQAHCDFLGDRSDIASILLSTDIFVLPSSAEGISNTILEAMACGVPVIASKVGGNVELVKHGQTGLLFPSNNIDDLKSCLLSYIQDPPLREAHGKQARKRAVNQFSLSKMINQYQALYLSLANINTRV